MIGQLAASKGRHIALLSFRFLDSQKITMIRLYFSTVVILVALGFTPYEISAKCKQSDSTGFTYSNGKAILDQHNYLRRSVGVKDLKWSNNLEYMAWYVLKNTNNECTHSATNRYKDEIKGKYHLFLTKCLDCT